jgi:hypothetical protein
VLDVESIILYIPFVQFFAWRVATCLSIGVCNKFLQTETFLQTEGGGAKTVKLGRGGCIHATFPPLSKYSSKGKVFYTNFLQ